MHMNNVRQGEARNDLGYVLGLYYVQWCRNNRSYQWSYELVKYIETLDNHLWPVVAKHFGNSAWIFQEDNAPCHVSRQCNADNNIPILPWPESRHNRYRKCLENSH